MADEFGTLLRTAANLLGDAAVTRIVFSSTSTRTCVSLYVGDALAMQFVRKTERAWTEHQAQACIDDTFARLRRTDTDTSIGRTLTLAPAMPASTIDRTLARRTNWSLRRAISCVVRHALMAHEIPNVREIQARLLDDARTIAVNIARRFTFTPSASCRGTLGTPVTDIWFKNAFTRIAQTLNGRFDDVTTHLAIRYDGDRPNASSTLASLLPAIDTVLNMEAVYTFMSPDPWYELAVDEKCVDDDDNEDLCVAAERLVVALRKRQRRE